MSCTGLCCWRCRGPAPAEVVSCSAVTERGRRKEAQGTGSARGPRAAGRDTASYGRTSHNDLWHAQKGWNEHDHAAPRHMLIPARQTGVVSAGQETVQPPQLSRAGISQACKSHPAPAPVDTRRFHPQMAPIKRAAETRRPMRSSVIAQSADRKFRNETLSHGFGCRRQQLNGERLDSGGENSRSALPSAAAR
jgi:hypothetical protein